MAKLDTNEFIDEDGETCVEAILENAPLLPSQTRNPQYGIYPWLMDEQSVVRVPISNDLTVNRLSGTSNPEVYKLYLNFRIMALSLIRDPKAYGINNKNITLSSLNRVISSGRFDNFVEKISEVDSNLLREYLHPSIHEVIQNRQSIIGGSY